MSCAGGLCTSGPTCVATVVAGETHTCAVLGSWLKCWGKNDSGQLGQGDREARGDDPGEMGDKLPPVSLGVGRYVPASDPGSVRLALGSAHTCVVLDGGDVKCWGDNRMGQLGLGAPSAAAAGVDRGDDLPPVDLGRGRTARSLAAGAYHTCALLEDGDVKCWGDNRFGQLGLGAPGNRGLTAGDMGDNLTPVSLGPGAHASSLAAGAYHTCAVLAEGGAVKCWGWNDYGQLGLGDSRPRGLVADDMGAALAAVPIGEGRGALQLAAGTYHTCALLDSPLGGIKCWGYNGAGQLGRGSLGPQNPIRIQRIGTGPFTAEDLHPVDLGPGRSALAITAGSAHVCAVLDDHSLRCWGLNMFGQLGIGTNDNRGDDLSETGVHLPAVKVGRGTLVSSVSAGAHHTCAVQGPTVHCWGLNSYGRLGHGSAPGQRISPPAAVDLGSAARP
jgi:alpha-tubulin suppressor-like RCC1 family protein